MDEKLRPYDVLQGVLADAVVRERDVEAGAEPASPSHVKAAIGPAHLRKSAVSRRRLEPTPPPVEGPRLVGLQGWLNALPFGLLVVRPDGVMEHASAQAAELLGYTPEELVGSSVEALVPDAMVAAHQALRESWSGDAFAAPMSRLRTVEARRKDGTCVPVHIELSRPWEGQPGHTLVTLRDMRPQLALESQIHRLKRMENLGLLAAGAVHDFNNHLTALELIIDTHRGEGMPWPDVRDTTRQLRQLVDGLHRVAGSESETVRLFDLCALMAEHTTVLERMASGRLSLALPTCAAWVHGRPSELVQTVVNLLLNAAHAQKEAGVVQPVELVVAVGAGVVELSVVDHGVGMTEDQLQRACEPGVTSRGHKGGSGLGLAIARSVAESHGGRLLLRSVPGEGTTATLRLPLSREDAPTG